MSNTLGPRTTVIATSNNVAVYTEGQPISTVTSTKGTHAKQTYLVAPGQVVFFNPATGLSTGTAATKSTVPLLMAGVAIDSDGDGSTDYIRWFNDGFTGCSARSLDGRAPNCGLASITDIFFGCAECNQTYTIEVQVYDPITEAFGSKSLGYIYHFSYTLPCGDCTTGDCVEVAANADEIMCGLYNKIKGIENDPNWDIKLNGFPLPRDHEYRFDVAKLYDGTATDFSDNTTFEYCLTQSDTACENCDVFTAIGGYSLDGDPDVVFSPATFTGTTSTRGQLASAIDQLNVALAGNGSAVFIPAVGNCCTNHKIEVNTCLLDFELHDHEGTVITPCATSNPFSELTRYSECQDCNSANSTITQRAGLRFYSKPIEGECGCLNGNKDKVEYYGEIEAYPVHGFKSNGGAWSARRQAATLPEGQGFEWQGKEIRTLRQPGTEPFVIKNFGGKYGFPEANDLLNQVTTNCKERYCVISAVIQQKTKHEMMGEVYFVPQTIYLLIPADHTTASASVLTALNNYLAGGDCGVASISCA